MNYEISSDRNRMQLATIHGMLVNSYWSPNIRLDVVEAAICNSMVIGAFLRHDDGRDEQLGFARAITDGATFAWLCDVFVLPEHRSRGLATRMIRALMDDPALKTLRRWALATKDAHELYKDFGFTPADPLRWMELKLPPGNWQNVSEKSG